MARRKSTTATARTAKPAPAADERQDDNIITLAGRLVADPVLGQTKSGKSVTTIRLAVNPPEGDATFHRVVVWNRTAEVVCQYMRKGRLVQIVGREQKRSYTDGDGTERTVTEISAFRVQFLPREAQAPAAEKEVA